MKLLTRWVAVSVLILASGAVQAATDNWTCSTSNDWDNAACWDAGVPVANDDAYVTTTSNGDLTVNYVNPNNNPQLNTLWIGDSGAGTLTLSQTQDNLSVAGEEFVGFSGTTSVFTQSGGTNTVNGSGLVLGYYGGSNSSSGTYNLSGSGALSASGEDIGYTYNGAVGTATSVFDQSGGTNTVGGLVVGESAGGSYTLTAGSLSATGGAEYIGEFAGGIGTFTQSGGTHTVSGDLDFGLSSGASGSYALSGTGSLSVAGGEIIGDSIGPGTFTQSGGTHTVGSDLTLGNESGSSGSYTLSAGNLSVTGAEIIGNARVGTGTGTFTQSGGTNAVGNVFILGDYSGGSGSYTLTAGSLSVNGPEEDIGYNGTGTFTQSGGTNSVNNGTVTIAANPGSSGTYNLSGGTLTANTLTNNSAFNYSGGTLNTTSLTNNLHTTFSGAGTRIVTGTVVNNGSIKVTNTTVSFTGTFTNNGSYASDPSTNQFTNLIIDSNGYITGSTGDEFSVSGNFTNNSTQNALWNTGLSTLVFTGAGTYTFTLAGKNDGAIGSGYTNNFAWGTLDLTNTSGVLSLGTGNASFTDALYVDALLGVTVSGDTVTNIAGNGLNLYYLSSDPANSYLGDQTYALSGGGSLIPVSAVPLPAAVWLFGPGLLGLLGIARRRAA